ncbi:MAG TPA: hypothetical protein VEY30_11645 [Myxococcaceae bacterium]|nr:hypothetical protein [Myxococcaceae bacterium]
MAFNLKAWMVGLAVFAPAVAVADHDERWDYRGPPAAAHPVHYPQSPPPPPGRAYAPGRYELRTVHRWIPARQEQVWVPEVCRSHPRHRWVRCRPGYYQTRWVPGYQEQFQDWVWVPAPYRARVQVSAYF